MTANNPAAPQIIFFPSGDMSPFVLKIGAHTQAAAYTLIGQENGNVSMTTVNR